MNPLALLSLLWQYRKAAAILAAGAFLFGAGWTANGWRWEAKQAAATEKANEAWAEKATGLEIQLELQSRKAREINQRLANETRKDTYRCVLPDDGLSLFNAARAATGQPDR